MPDSSDSHGARNKRAIHAVRWTLFGNIAQRLITFGSVAVIARLISETEYGAYRQLLSVHLVIFVLLPLGFDQLYIREVQQRSRFLMLLGGALSLTAAVLAVVTLAGHQLFVHVMDFGPWSEMLWLFPALVALQARKLVYKTDLAANLDYRDISYGEMIYAFISGVGGILLVLWWRSAWALYISYGLAELIELLWLRRRSTVIFPPIATAVRELRQHGWQWRRFGLFHCGNQVLNSLGANAPVIIFGAALSKAAAAAFSMANWMVTIPIYVLIGALHKVAFSALAGRTREQLVSPVLQMLSLAAAFIVPVLIWVAVMAEPLVRIVLGESWVDSTAPVARLLSLYCIFAALFSPVSSLDILLDRPDYGFYWNVGATIVRVAAVVLGLRYGVMEAVVAYAVSSAILWVIWGMMLARLLGAGQWRFHWSWLRMTPVWIGLGVMLWGVLKVTSNDWVALGASGGPALVYTLLLFILWPAVFRQGLKLIQIRGDNHPQASGS